LSDRIRALIVDDESLARRGLLIRLQGLPDVEVVGEASSGRSALEAIRRLQPDVVFLDIEMPGMSGLDVVGQLPTESMPLVVFVTAYDRYAVEAFDARALDYVLKPVDEERFAAALENVRRQLQQRRAAGQRDRLVQLMADLRGASDWPEDLMDLAPEEGTANAPAPVLAVRQGRDIVRVPMSTIDWIDAAGDYMCVHTSAQTYILRGTMKSLEDVLDPAVFQRVHRSTIVNLDRVERLRPHMNGEFFLVLSDGHEIKLSRTFRDKVEHFLQAGPVH
jgi:two-component system LytT family response regulator